MAITKSGKKAHRQSLKKRVINNRRASTMKEAVKAVRSSSKASAAEKLREAFKALDKAAKRGVIKKGQADRKKSRLAKAIAKLA